MNSRVLTVSLTGVGLLMVAWLLRSTNRKEGHACPQETQPTPQVSQGSSSDIPPASPAWSRPATGRASVPRSADPTLADWVAQRSAGVAVNQTQQGKLRYPGSITLAGLTADLGETPPLIHHQLQAKNCALLLGEIDNRHAYQRHLCTVRHVAGNPAVNYEVSVAYPRSATQGGFVFRRNEPVINTVGVVIPDVKVPAGDDPSAPRWAVTIRVRGRILGSDELAKVQPQPLDSSTVVLMQTHPGPMAPSARILWLELDDNGSLVVNNR